MRKKGRMKYFFVFFLCTSIFVYGFFRVNITKAKNVRENAKFTIDFTLDPVDLKIETSDYVFYINHKIIDKLKNTYNDIYNGVFPK